MKTSNKILLGAFVGILVMCIAILMTIRLALNDPRTDRSRSIKKHSIGLKEITITECNRIDLKGNWEARIVRAEKENIRVKGPEDLLAALSVNRYSCKGCV